MKKGREGRKEENFEGRSDGRKRGRTVIWKKERKKRGSEER